jgi:chemotaxis protein CheD
MNIEKAIGGFEPFILKPGEIYFSDGPSVVATILGSCISLTMHSSSSGFGAICHNVLPKCAKRNSCIKVIGCNEWPKYVECSMREMLKKLDELGISRSEAEFKLFGGAEMLDKIPPVIGRSKTVGAENVRVALKILAKEGLKVAIADTGGTIGRKLFFVCHTGEVYLKRLVTNSENKCGSLQSRDRRRML